MTPNTRPSLRDGWTALRVKLVIYPGAYHAFDAPNLAEGTRLFGHWLKYDAEAAPRSLQDMHDFLATELNE